MEINNDKPKHGLIYYLSMVTIFLALGTMLYAFYLLFYPFKTVEYFNEPFPVQNLDSEVRQGEILSYEVELCRFTDSPVTITRELHNDVIITLPTITSNFNEGCATLIIARDEIPEHVPEGEYRLVQTAQFRINPLRTITHRVETETFRVIK